MTVTTGCLVAVLVHLLLLAMSGECGHVRPPTINWTLAMADNKLSFNLSLKPTNRIID